MKIALTPDLTAGDLRLLGHRLILAGPKKEGSWRGRWFGLARVVRQSTRLDGVSLLVGEDPAALLAELRAAPDPAVVVLYLGPRKGRQFSALERAVAAYERSGRRCCMTSGSARAELATSRILSWEAEEPPQPAPAPEVTPAPDPAPDPAPGPAPGPAAPGKPERPGD